MYTPGVVEDEDEDEGLGRTDTSRTEGKGDGGGTDPTHAARPSVRIDRNKRLSRKGFEGDPGAVYKTGRGRRLPDTLPLIDPPRPE